MVGQAGGRGRDARHGSCSANGRAVDREDRYEGSGEKSAIMWIRRGLKKFSFHSATMARIRSRRAGVSSVTKERRWETFPGVSFPLWISSRVGNRKLTKVDQSRLVTSRATYASMGRGKVRSARVVSPSKLMWCSIKLRCAPARGKSGTFRFSKYVVDDERLFSFGSISGGSEGRM